MARSPDNDRASTLKVIRHAKGLSGTLHNMTTRPVSNRVCFDCENKAAMTDKACFPADKSRARHIH